LPLPSPLPLSLLPDKRDGEESKDFGACLSDGDEEEMDEKAK